MKKCAAKGIVMLFACILCMCGAAIPHVAAEGLVLLAEDGTAPEVFTGAPLYAVYCGTALPAERVSVAIALYSGGRLAAMQMQAYTSEALAAGSAAVSGVLHPPTLGADAPEQYKVRAFAFDEQLRPLCAAAELKAARGVVFEYTKNALPGEAVGVHGGGFCNGAEILLEQIETAQGTVVCNRMLEVLTESECYIGTQLPEDIPAGIYTLRVKNGTFKSTPIRINAPETWQVMDTAGTDIAPGYTFALYGNNLDFAGAAPQVKLKEVSTGREYAAQVQDGDDKFQLAVTAPQELIPGESYDIYVNNGFGTQYEQGPRVGCIAAGADALGLDVPWGSAFDGIAAHIINVREEPYCAAGDGSADDSAAIQAAINDAAAAGGGVVYLPEGVYNTAGTMLTVQPRVVLKGDGMERTVLTTITMPADNTCMLKLGGDTAGLMGLHIVSPEDGFVHIVHTNRKKQLFILDCKLENWRAQNACAVRLDLCSNVLLKNNEFYNHGKQNTNRLLSLDTNTDLWLTGNKMEWRTSRIMMTASTRIQCDYNEMWRWTDADFDYFDNVLGRYAHAGYFSLSGGNDILVAHNTAGKKGGGLLEHRSDGEFVLYEGSNQDCAGIGQVTAADAGSLSDTNGSWAADLSAYTVTITAGKGMGQTRGIAANTQTAMMVDRAWDIIPDGTSCYSICKPAAGHIMVRDNMLNEISNGILFYQAVLDGVIIAENQLNDSPNIWLRAAQKQNQGQLNIIRDVLIEHNTMRNTKNYYPAQIIVQAPYVNGDRIYGTGFFNIAVRRNIVQAYNSPGENHPGTQWKRAIPDEGYFCHVSPEVPLSDHAAATQRGVIFDGNTAINCKHAYYINTGAYQTMILNTKAENCGQLVWDDDLATAEFGGTHASVDTVIRP